MNTRPKTKTGAIAFTLVLAAVLTSGTYYYQRKRGAIRRLQAAYDAQTENFNVVIKAVATENQRMLSRVDAAPEPSQAQVSSRTEAERRTRVEALKKLTATAMVGQGTTISAAQRMFELGFLPEPPAFQIDWAGKLPKGFAELFGLTEDTAAKLDEHLTFTKQSIQDLYRRNSTLIQAEAGDWKLTTQKLAPEITDTFDRELQTAFKTALGDELYDSFATLNGRRFGPPGPPEFGGPRDFFGGFGRYSQEITIQRTAPDTYSYRIAFPSGLANRPGGTQTVSGANLTRERLKKFLEPYLADLPPDL